MGRRKRYRLIELDRVLAAVGAGNLPEFRAHYHHCIEERLARGAMKREPQWTESLAVGSQEFVAQVGSDLVHRRKFEILRLDTAEHSWALRENKSP